MQGNLDPSVLAELDRRIAALDPLADLKATVARLYQIADVLHSGPPPREMFLLAAAIALRGAALCAARDARRPPIAGAADPSPPSAAQHPLTAGRSST